MQENRPNPEKLLEQINKQHEQKQKGKLKIFFGYSAGVGKTYAMLEEAHNIKQSGVDVVIGYVEPHQRPATLALMEGLEQIPPLKINYQGISLYEFDLDNALARKPQLILVDELAHTNAKTCRHSKRYKDIEELLRMGIDVYTTVNVQHIEGLCDTIESVTGVIVRERIPDSVINSADKMELVDIEPEDLIKRLNDGKIYQKTQAQKALSNFFTKENLVALREIALRRTADRVNITVKQNKGNSQYYTDEHILMCLSSSPANAKVIRTAAKMAKAFDGKFTALFVETQDFLKMTQENKKRLDDNTRLAEQLGANIITVYGDDIAYQTAEYAKASGVSKIVLGRPVNKHIFGLSAKNYVDKLTAFAPELEVYVIPNKLKQTFKQSQNQTFKLDMPKLSTSDVFLSLGYLTIATLIGILFDYLEISETNTIIAYIMATQITALTTTGKIYGIVTSILSVLLFNFFFTDPRYTLNVYGQSYPVTFAFMFLASIITSTLAKRAKEQARQSSLQAHRMQILLETTQKLQQAKSREEIFTQTITQIQKLLSTTAIIYPFDSSELKTPISLEQVEKINKYFTQDEKAVAQWVAINNKHAGATTSTLSGAKCLYMSIRSGEKVFAVAGVALDKKEMLEPFEKNLLLAILSETAFTLEKQDILENQKQILLKANSEQLRTSLLRAISHDLRTPLTGIAGGSGLLLEQFDKIDKDTQKTILQDIQKEALWLSNLVENLLNMTKIQDGLLVVSKKPELIDEIITASIEKVQKKTGTKTITVQEFPGSIFVPMDAQLIIQVLINLLDNAIKHTNENSKITISYQQLDGLLQMQVTDDGGGIPLQLLDKVFEPFYTMSKTVNDKNRGMGLGLNICKSIIEAHGGTITAKNNEIGGATFTIDLPLQ